jgi:hypothetical protein
MTVTACSWVLRDGSGCRSRAAVGEFCSAHFEMAQVLKTEDAARANRGEPPLSGRLRDVFLKDVARARKAARRSLQTESVQPATPLRQRP